MKSIKHLAAAALFGLFTPTMSSADDPAPVVMHRSIKPVESGPAVASQRMKATISRLSLTSAESNAKMEFEVALRLRNFSELNARIDRHEHISIGELDAKYLPLSASYDAVLRWLTKKGFTITVHDPNHMAVFAKGTVSQIQQVMNVKFARVIADNIETTSALTAPSVPAEIAPFLVGVNGLQPHIRMHRGTTANPALAPITNPLPPSNIFPPFEPSDIATAYHADSLYQSGVTGDGETIAILVESFPRASDLTKFWQTYGIPQSLDNISFISEATGPMPDPDDEGTLDVEWASSIAYGAHVRVYAAGSTDEKDFDRVFQAITLDARTDVTSHIHQLSISYGKRETDHSEDEMDTEDQYFAILNTLGVTTFVGSGDDGATPSSTKGVANGPVEVYFPASSTHVISVGGTTVELDGYGDAISETAWSGSGGGRSQYFPRPAWQAGPGVPAGPWRLVPDVSCAADPDTGAEIVYNGFYKEVGGTSWGTPTWAGFCALLNQVHANGPRPFNSIGSFTGLCSTLYPLIGTNAFRDITSGSNATPVSNGLYSAGIGYDMVTGIGVPDVQNLSYALSPNDEALYIDGTPPDASLQTPYNFQYTTRGSFGPTFFLASGSLPPGLSLSSLGLISGTPTQEGTFAGTIEALTTGGTGTADFNITVNSPTFRVLHIFGDGTVLNDGLNPTNLVLGKDGNFYGTTAGGGSGTVVTNFGPFHGLGTFFRMTPDGTVTILHNFGDGTVANEGAGPLPGLKQMDDGAFYGSASGDVGLVTFGSPDFFKITTSGSESILHSGVFGDGLLVQGSNGDLYASSGATILGGINSATIYTLHTFAGSPNDGAGPISMILGADNKFYGTTRDGGSQSEGTAFVMDAAGNEHILHDFDVDIIPPGGGFFEDPVYQPLNLLQASDGTFYGITRYDNVSGSGGGFFSMTSQGFITALHHFGDGTVPNGGLTPDGTFIKGSDGNFYGTTFDGGANGKGVVFKITPDGAETILHSFSVNDGQGPHTLVQGLDGNLYGTTYVGSGFFGNQSGEIFEIGKQTQTISFSGIADQMIGNTVTLSGTSSSGLAVTYTVTGPASLLDNVLTITGVGTVTVTAIQSGDSTYGPAAPVVQTFQGTKISQTIMFAAIGGQVFGVAPLTLTATASSGLPVSYSVVSGPATVSGSTLTITGTGSVSVRASQSGSANYLAAPSVLQTFTVNPAPATPFLYFQNGALEGDLALGSSFTPSNWQGLGSLGSWQQRAIGDLNGDGVPDIICQNGTLIGAVIMNSSGAAVSWVGIGSMNSGWQLRGAVELSNDGNLDLIFQNGTLLGYLEANTSGVPQSWNGIGAMGAGWQLRAVAALDGSGRPDLIFQNGTLLGALEVGTNGVPTAWTGIGAMSVGWTLSQPAYVNVNGRPSLIFQNGTLLGALDVNTSFQPVAWHGIGAMSTGWTLPGDY
jgi:kumamolisin